MPTKYLAALGVSTILLVSVSALAEGAPSDDPFEQGLELQEQGKFADALSAFQRARAKNPTPMVALHVAECEAATGRLARAEEHLRGLVAAPIREGSPAAFYATQAQASVELDKVSPRVAHLRIRVSSSLDDDLSLAVDGIAVDPAHRAEPQAVDPGVHEIVATAGRDRRASATVRVREGQTAEAVLVWGIATLDAERWQSSHGVRAAGIGVLITGSVAIGIGFWAVLVGSLMDFCWGSGDYCRHRGDGVMMGGGIAVVAGGLAAITGIGLMVSGRRGRPRSASVGQTVVPLTTRAPTWSTVVERVPPSGLPIVVPIFSGTF